MKNTHSALILSCLLMVSCSSSKPSMQSDAASSNSNIASSNLNSSSRIAQATADNLNEQRATEVLRDFVNNNFSGSGITYVFLSVGPFFPTRIRAQ